MPTDRVKCNPYQTEEESQQEDADFDEYLTNNYYSNAPVINEDEGNTKNSINSCQQRSRVNYFTRSKLPIEKKLPV